MIRDYTAIVEVKFQDLLGDMDDQEVCEAISESLDGVDAELIHVLEEGKNGSQRRLVLERPSDEKTNPSASGTELPLGPTVDLAYTRTSQHYAGARATNREALLKAVECYYVDPEKRHGWGAITLQDDPPALRIALPCGSVREWHLKEWLPYDSVECHCGGMEGRHFFVLYTDPAYTEKEKEPRWWERWQDFAPNSFRTWLVWVIAFAALVLLVAL